MSLDAMIEAAKALGYNFLNKSEGKVSLIHKITNVSFEFEYLKEVLITDEKDTLESQPLYRLLIMPPQELQKDILCYSDRFDALEAIWSLDPLLKPHNNRNEIFIGYENQDFCPEVNSHYFLTLISRYADLNYMTELKQGVTSFLRFMHSYETLVQVRNETEEPIHKYKLIRDPSDLNLSDLILKFPDTWYSFVYDLFARAAGRKIPREDPVSVIEFSISHNLTQYDYQKLFYEPLDKPSLSSGSTLGSTTFVLSRSTSPLLMGCQHMYNSNGYIIVYNNPDDAQKVFQILLEKDYFSDVRIIYQK